MVQSREVPWFLTCSRKSSFAGVVTVRRRLFVLVLDRDARQCPTKDQAGRIHPGSRSLQVAAHRCRTGYGEDSSCLSINKVLSVKAPGNLSPMDQASVPSAYNADGFVERQPLRLLLSLLSLISGSIGKRGAYLFEGIMFVRTRCVRKFVA